MLAANKNGGIEHVDLFRCRASGNHCCGRRRGFRFGAGFAQTIVPQTALTPSGQYYTDLIGGGIGAIAGIGGADGRNDDQFVGPISFGYTLTFFGSNYSQFYLNNNGNISFGQGISAYVPTGPTGANAPVISPWFADVDTRGALSGVVHLRSDIANETIATWDQVGYYNSHDNLLNSFQLVVRSPNFVIPAGQGSIGFFYRDMPWEATNTSQVAAIGFGDGMGASEVLQGSTTPGLNAVVANHFIWFDQNLAVVPPVLPPIAPVPEPETYAMMLLGLAGLGAFARRRKSR